MPLQPLANVSGSKIAGILVTWEDAYSYVQNLRLGPSVHGNHYPGASGEPVVGVLTSEQGFQVQRRV